MDNRERWASVLQAAEDPARTLQADKRISLLKTALDLGLSLSADSVGCSITLATGAGYVTPAASSSVAMELDLAQYVNNDGPCVAACRDGLTHSIVIMGEEDAYPRFTAVALEHGVLSSLSLPLPSRPSAALNLYASTTNAFTSERANSTASLLARCVVRFLPEPPVGPPRARDFGMDEALERRALMRRACQRLAERDGITPPEAFTVMTLRSREQKCSIFVIAAEILKDATHQGATGKEGPS